MKRHYKLNLTCFLATYATDPSQAKIAKNCATYSAKSELVTTNKLSTQIAPPISWNLQQNSET
jgi:hypothetical protein